MENTPWLAPGLVRGRLQGSDTNMYLRPLQASAFRSVQARAHTNRPTLGGMGLTSTQSCPFGIVCSKFSITFDVPSALRTLRSACGVRGADVVNYRQAHQRYGDGMLRPELLDMSGTEPMLA